MSSNFLRDRFRGKLFEANKFKNDRFFTEVISSQGLFSGDIFIRFEIINGYHWLMQQINRVIYPFISTLIHLPLHIHLSLLHQVRSFIILMLQQVASLHCQGNCFRWGEELFLEDRGPVLWKVTWAHATLCDGRRLANWFGDLFTAWCRYVWLRLSNSYSEVRLQLCECVYFTYYRWITFACYLAVAICEDVFTELVLIRLSVKSYRCLTLRMMYHQQSEDIVTPLPSLRFFFSQEANQKLLGS